jgi:glycosyltransferase involved in cell wall biosynthesis
MPKVSVIMPVYNGSDYISLAIESVLCQSSTDWELIVIDDGSTDTTPDILERFTDTRIVRIWQENGGEAKARNTGLNHIRGDYFAFLDADDLYLPNALADRSKYLDEHPEYSVVVSNGNFCDTNGEILGCISDLRPQTYVGNILEPLILNPSVVSVPVGTMTRSSVVKHYGLQFDPNIGYGTDWDFWIRLGRHVQFGYLDKLTFMYRVHGTNMTQAISRQKLKRDWTYGRIKILDSDWFQELSAPTQFNFFRMLLLNLMDNQPMQQKAILEGEKFGHLSKQDQAHLWRLIGADYVLTGNDQGFALECFQKAVELWPHDQKSQYLLHTFRYGQPVVRNLLRLWRVLHGIVSRLHSMGQRRPKPLPKQLKMFGG